MKIGQISKHYFPIVGGQQTYIQNLIDVFNNNNIESKIFQPYAPGANEKENVVVTSPFEILQRLDRYVQNIGWFIFNFELFFFKSRLAEQDIIISHYSFHYPTVKWHKRVIILSHGVLWSNKLQTFFDRILHKMDSTILDQKGVFIVANDTDFLRRIGVSVREGLGYFKEVKENVWFIPNCIDDNFFSPDSRIKKEKVLLVPRNIRPDRGIDLAIKAFVIFSRIHPEFTLKIIGGPCKGKYFKYCDKLIDDLGVREKVFFAGSVEWSDMPDEYRRATLTIVPSIEKEGTSLSALESMGCGTVVVGTNVAGLKDLPIVKAKPTPEDLAQKLNEALLDADRLSINQFESIKTTFNIRNWEKSWIEVVTKIYNAKLN